MQVIWSVGHMKDATMARRIRVLETFVGTEMVQRLEVLENRIRALETAQNSREED